MGAIGCHTQFKCKLQKLQLNLNVVVGGFVVVNSKISGSAYCNLLCINKIFASSLLALAATMCWDATSECHSLNLLQWNDVFFSLPKCKLCIKAVTAAAAAMVKCISINKQKKKKKYEIIINHLYVSDFQFVIHCIEASILLSYCPFNLFSSVSFRLLRCIVVHANNCIEYYCITTAATAPPIFPFRSHSLSHTTHITVRYSFWLHQLYLFHIFCCCWIKKK